MGSYELIIVIANSGYSDIIMNAAREAGAKGGTILNARGTGTKEMEKKYGIVITPLKETVNIVVETEIRDQVMSAINAVAGLESKASSIIFSLPISNVSGATFDDEKKKKKK